MRYQLRYVRVEVNHTGPVLRFARTPGDDSPVVSSFPELGERPD